MDLGAILLTLALALLVGVFISRPFFDRRFETQALLVRQRTARSEHDLSALQAEKDHVLTQLQDLDFDLTMGKVSKEDYHKQRALLLQSGAEVLRKLDEAGAGQKPARAASAAVSAGGGSGDEIERMIAARRQEMRQSARQETRGEAAGFCPKCGRPVQKVDRFCPKCGASL